MATEKPPKEHMDTKRKTAEHEINNAGNEELSTENGIQNNTIKFRPGRLFWGGILLIIGFMLLLENLGVAEFSIGSLWRLWPLAIVAIGFSILSVSSRLWRALSILFIIATLTLVVLVGTSTVDIDTTQSQAAESVTLVNENIDSAQIDIKMGAGELKIRSADESGIVVRSTLDSNAATLNQSEATDDSTKQIWISLEGSSSWWIGNQPNNLATYITKELPFSLSADIGAASVDADFSELLLSDLTIKTGASSASLKIGDKVDFLPIRIEAGVSDISVMVPRSSGVRVTTEGGLSSNDLRALNEKDNGVFESENYEEADKKVEIQVKTGLSSFSLERY